MKPARLPSQSELISALAICAFPVNIWALFIFSHELPAYLMHYKLSDVAGILAYVLAFALLETALATAFIVFIAVILPRRWFLSRFTAQSFVLVSTTTLWFIMFHFWNWRERAGTVNTSEGTQLSLSTIWLPALFWGITYLAASGGISALLHRSHRFEKWLQNTAERFVIPSAVFLFADLLGILIVIVRNLL